MYAGAGLRGNATCVAHELLNVTDFAHCDDCALATLRRLDFSHLCSYTLDAQVSDAETGRSILNPGRELRKLHPLKTTQIPVRQQARKPAEKN